MQTQSRQYLSRSIHDADARRNRWSLSERGLRIDPHGVALVAGVDQGVAAAISGASADSAKAIFSPTQRVNYGYSKNDTRYSSGRYD